MEMEYAYMGNVVTTRLFGFFALFIAVGVLTRRAIPSFAPCPGTLKHIMQDAVTAFEVYGCNVGHIYVFQIYGLGTYLIVLLIVGIYHAYFLKGYTANPITYVLQYLTNCCPLTETIRRVTALVIGGIAGHLTATVFWPVLMTEFDVQTLGEMHCVTANTTMPVTVYLGVEFFGMVLTSLLVFNITSSSVDTFEPPMKFVITCLLSGAGLCVSKVYLNPVVASIRLIGCDGKDFFLHLVIYWIAPICGAAVAALHKDFNSNDSDLVCLPICKCETSCLQSGNACSELNSDFDPDSNTSCQETRSRTLLSYVHMPPICVSRAEEEDAEDEVDENSDEVIYRCEKYLDVGRNNSLNQTEQASSTRCRRRLTEQPFDDTYCREFRGSNPTRLSDTVTFSKTYGIHKCSPISTAGTHIDQSLSDDSCTVNDMMTTTNSCCGYREPLSCSCCRTAAMRRCFCTSVLCNSSTDDKSNARTLTFGDDNETSAFCALKDTCTIGTELLPLSKERLQSCSLVQTRSEYKISGEQSCSICGVPHHVSSSHKTDTQAVVKTTADNRQPEPPHIRQRSQHRPFKAPLRDNSQSQGIDSDTELFSTTSIYKFEPIVPSSHTLTHELDEKPSKASSTSMVQPSQSPKTPPSSSSMVQPSNSPKTPSPYNSMVQPSQPSKTPSPSSSMVQPSQPPKIPSPINSIVQPSQPPHTFSFHISLVETKSSHSSRHRKVPKISPHHVSRGHQSPNSRHCVPDSQPKPSHKHSHKSSHKTRTSKHTKSQRTPSPANRISSHNDSCKSSRKTGIDNRTKPSHESAPSHDDPYTSTSQGEIHMAVPCPTPSHDNQRRLSPSGRRSRTPSCQRSKYIGSRRSFTT